MNSQVDKTINTIETAHPPIKQCIFQQRLKKQTENTYLKLQMYILPHHILCVNSSEHRSPLDFQRSDHMDHTAIVAAVIYGLLICIDIRYETK